jgi:hypothetical protein
MPYIYENHISGNCYTSEHELDYDDLYCETCGDSDWPVGYAATDERADEMIKRFEMEREGDCDD